MSLGAVKVAPGVGAVSPFPLSLEILSKEKMVWPPYNSPLHLRNIPKLKFLDKEHIYPIGDEYFSSEIDRVLPGASDYTTTMEVHVQ